MLTKIWQRYFFKEALKVLTLFLFSFYFLFVLIDYSTHAKMFHAAKFPAGQIFNYYLLNFTKRLDVLIPFALLLATLKVLYTSNQRRELIAFFAGGLSLKKILQPFLLLALFSSSLLYFNTQTLLPHALKELQKHKDAYLLEKITESKIQNVNTLHLKDGSTLVYQKYDTYRLAFFDLFWIQNANEIYHIKYLYPNETPPRAEFVDHFTRNKDGLFLKTESFDTKLLSTLSFDLQGIQEATIPVEQLSLTELLEKFSSQPSRESTAALFYKLLLPLVCFLVVLIPAPFCMRYNRNSSPFFLYGLSLFGLVSFFTVMQTAYILAGSSMGSPIWLLVLPMLSFYLIASWQYYKIQT